MRKMGIVWICLLLVTVLALSACTKKEKEMTDGTSKESQTPATTEQTQTTVPDETAGYTLPIVKDGSVTLRYGGWDNWYAPKSLALNLPVWQEVEKRTGVKIKWEVAPVGEYATTMQAKLAAGKDLPDIIALPIELDKAIDMGVLEPLDDLIDEYAPNIKKFYAENPVEYNKIKAFDGKLYSLGAVTTGLAYSNPYGFLIRKDWLDKLNLQEPKSLDDWYNVLKAFKEKDPNGNGKPDEIPFMPQYGTTGLGMFGNALGLHFNYSHGYYPDENGKVRFEWMTPEAKELVIWFNKLYTEGLLDPSFLQTTEEHIIAGISRDQVGSTIHFVNHVDQYNTLSAQAGATNPDWILTLPPAQPGYKAYYEKYGPVSGNYVIPKQSKNKEIAIKWLDFIYASEEGNRLQMFGVEGLSYKMVNGEPEYTDFVLNNPDGLDPPNTLRSIGAYATTPWIIAGKGPMSKSPLALMKNNPKLQEQVKRVENMMVDNEPFAAMTPQEAEQLSVISPDMQNYVDETIVNYITGKEPMDWDKFVNKLKEYGIDKVLEVKQKQYERFINN